jgi:hypothetical protein
MQLSPSGDDAATTARCDDCLCGSGEPDLVALFGSYDDAPAATNFLSQYKNLLHHYMHQTAREEASTFWGACGAIRREVSLAVGGIFRIPSNVSSRSAGEFIRRDSRQVIHHRIINDVPDSFTSALLCPVLCFVL